ncbi:MAG: NAD(P)H-dependent oxidoreductase [Desulfobacterales bacterium]|nr:NAD(P)H-dependent oxidoreductase [Desulfobacterales bacterium]
MKVFAVNSSARTGDVSKTETMLDCLVQGMREQGADVDVINLRKKKSRYCLGCFTCWTKTPGRCVHKDDMTAELFPKYRDCDLCILATPLFHYTVNAQMKTFIERTLPISLPFFEFQNGVTRHPARHEPPPVVMISVAGFPELSVFNQISSYANYLFGDRLVAEIYRTSSEMISASSTKRAITDIFEATIQGGRELVINRNISDETMARMTAQITDFEQMAPIGNLMWQTCIDEGVTLGDFQKKNMVPRPDSIKTFITIMKIGFNPAKTDNVKAIIQFNFSGKEKGNCHLAIEKSTLITETGPAENPDLTIDTPFDLWMDILTGKADGQQMFMDQKYSVSGNLELLIKFREFFGG